METIDLGDNHAYRFVGWEPDRSIPSNAERFAGIQDIERFGAQVPHLTPNGKPCNGFVTFDGEVQRKIHPGAPKWQVHSWEPLTLSPSLLCHCGDHGFIRDGKWVKA